MVPLRTPKKVKGLAIYDDRKNTTLSCAPEKRGLSPDYIDITSLFFYQLKQVTHISYKVRDGVEIT